MNKKQPLGSRAGGADEYGAPPGGTPPKAPGCGSYPLPFPCEAFSFEAVLKGNHGHQKRETIGESLSNAQVS